MSEEHKLTPQQLEDLPKLVEYVKNRLWEAYLEKEKEYKLQFDEELLFGKPKERLE